MCHISMRHELSLSVLNVSSIFLIEKPFPEKKAPFVLNVVKKRSEFHCMKLFHLRSQRWYCRRLFFMLLDSSMWF